MTSKIKKKLNRKLKRNRTLLNIRKWYRRATLPGFEGVSLRRVFFFLGQELKKDKIGPRASAIAFNFMLAIFPSLIFIFSLISFIGIEGFQESIYQFFQSVMPDQAFQLARKTIEDTLSQKRVDLLSISFVLTIIFATNGMNAILKTFSKINPAFKVRNFAREYGVAFMLTVMLTIMVFICMVLIFFGQPVIKYLLQELKITSGVTLWILIVLKWFIIIVIYFFGISILYYFGPALKTKWKFISLGGTVATILSIAASLGFAAYVNNFGQYNKLYGSLGTIIIIMSWMYINALVILIGFELNNSIRLFQLDQEDDDEEEFEESF